jgi:peptide-methionine (S)-S-oxide reductase
VHKVFIVVFSLLLPFQAQTRSVEMTKDEMGLKKVVFAGGCFWCMEKPFETEPGVKSVLSGYTGGHVDKPTYKQVSGGQSGHYEVIEVTYDPEVAKFERLLEIFWHNVDPVDAGGQFCDRGQQYSTAIFVDGAVEKAAAEASKTALQASGRLPGDVVTPILPAAEFFPAEDYHQDYYKVNPIRYKYYRYRCGRDLRLDELWGEDARH